jgi:hypothetical protein
MTPRIPNLGVRFVSFTTEGFYTRGNYTPFPIPKISCVPEQVWMLWSEKNILTLPGIAPQLL